MAYENVSIALLSDRNEILIVEVEKRKLKAKKNMVYAENVVVFARELTFAGYKKVKWHKRYELFRFKSHD